MSREITIVYNGEQSESLDNKIKEFLVSLNFEYDRVHRCNRIDFFPGPVHNVGNNKFDKQELTNFIGYFKGKSEKEWR